MPSYKITICGFMVKAGLDSAYCGELMRGDIFKSSHYLVVRDRFPKEATTTDMICMKLGPGWDHDRVDWRN